MVTPGEWAGEGWEGVLSSVCRHTSTLLGFLTSRHYFY